MQTKVRGAARRSTEQFRSASTRSLECAKPLQMNGCDLGYSMLRFLSSMYRPYVLQLFL